MLSVLCLLHQARGVSANTRRQAEPPGVREVMGSIPVGNSVFFFFFFVSRSCHVDQFTFRISDRTI